MDWSKESSALVYIGTYLTRKISKWYILMCIPIYYTRSNFQKINTVKPPLTDTSENQTFFGNGDIFTTYIYRKTSK